MRIQVSFFWGDSFARALVPALAEYSSNSGHGARFLIKPSCPPFTGFSSDSVDPGIPLDEACANFLRNIQQGLPAAAPN